MLVPRRDPAGNRVVTLSVSTSAAIQPGPTRSSASHISTRSDAAAAIPALRLRRAAAARGAHHLEVRDAITPAQHPFDGVIVRAVVDDDQLPVVAERLRRERGELLVDHRARVTRG